MKKLNTAEFVNRSNAVHNNTYDYSLTEYVTTNDKVTIICLLHGEFQQTPKEHLKGSGCTKCAIDKRKVTNTDRYGSTTPLTSPVLLPVIQQTNLERYGRVDGGASKEARQKAQNTCLEKFSVTNVFSDPKFQRLAREKMIEHYGAPSFLQTDEGKYKVRSTVFDKYAVSILPEAKDTCRHIEEFIKQLGISVEIDSVIITPLDSVDIYIPSHQIAIEYCGLHWHGEQFKDNTYHSRKQKACVKQGIQLLTIFEDEWSQRGQQVRNKIAHLLGKASTERVHARECVVVAVDNKSKVEFFDANHIQGSGPGSITYGLKFNQQFVAMMTFVSSGTTYTLSRYATSCRVPGGFTKLLKHFQNHHTWFTIESFADLRWSDGNLYSSTGWEYQYTIPPDYYWCEGTNRHHKFAFRRQQLPKKLAVFDPSLSEAENCRNNGLWKIYDCGKIKYSLTYR
jgi:hypothetical protein